MTILETKNILEKLATFEVKTRANKSYSYYNDVHRIHFSDTSFSVWYTNDQCIPLFSVEYADIKTIIMNY